MAKRIVVQKGDKINRLTVIREIESRSGWKGHAVRRLEAECDCGDIRGYDTKNVYSGNTRSCGCYQREIIRKANVARCTSHDKSYTRLYGVWANINHRCGMGEAEGRAGYAGRGIKVCSEWAGSFELFYEWAISSGYRQGLQIDRINNKGPYSPDNCRFITATQNMNNRRNSMRYHLYGKSYESVTEVCADLNIGRDTVRRRCCGYIKRGKFIPPKQGCWAERKYKDAA